MKLNPFPFIKRQLSTKTGRWCLGIVVGTIADSICKAKLGVGINAIPIAGPVLDKLFDPEVSAVLMGVSFMKDRDIKVDRTRASPTG